jgi:hypothetical protein
MSLSVGPFAKVVEWLDFQENLEGDSLFPILRLKPAAVPPLFRHPHESEDPEENERGNAKETQSTGSSRIWIPAFAGMTKSGIASIRCKDDPPDLVAVYPIFLQESRLVNL